MSTRPFKVKFSQCVLKPNDGALTVDNNEYQQ